MAQQGLDLFGKPIETKGDLKKEFGANPFTILDTKDGLWQARKRKWINLGIQSEVGRDATAYNTKEWAANLRSQGKMNGKLLPSNTSIFDPVLCELMYRWFCPDGGSILDPFAGGSVRGIVANYLGYHYSGIDIRKEQVESNREQALDILGVENLPQWYVGDSNIVLEQNWQKQFDLVFTSPPYANLEVYSNMQGDISNMEYDDFIFAFESIMHKACKLLKVGGMAIVVVGEVRNKKGEYYGFVADTVKLMQRCSGMTFYNDAILATSLASAALRAGGNMKSGKLVKVHQNVLMFKKT
jgi:DNA modification methylase|nr:MAG TPA: Putative modification methylase [Caudoviricetes sp.]